MKRPDCSTIIPIIMLNILITGANGQLGNEMRKLSAQSGDNYIFTDIAELDITDKDAVDRFVVLNNVDVIVNCAAYTNVEKAEDDEATADKINHRAAEILAQTAKKCDATLIHVSTDYVFDGRRNTPYTEDDTTTPLGAYGRTKLAGETAVAEAGCKYIIIRTAWLYSEFGNNFVKTMLRLTSERESVNVVSDQIGSPTYAGDLGSAIFDIIEHRKFEGNEGTYHFTDEGVCSWYDLAHETASIAGNKGCIINPCRTWEYPTKVSRPNYSVLDKSKFKATFGVAIPYWRESLAKCIMNIKNL